MNKPIQHIEEAQFVDVSSHLAAPLSDNGSRKIYDAIIGMSEKVFPNRRGQVFTIALTGAGLVNNAIDLNQYYLQNNDVIDGYFNRINMDKLGDAIGGSVDNSLKEQLPVFIAGAVLGVGSMVVLKAFRIL